jgi:hypothetical protein
MERNPAAEILTGSAEAVRQIGEGLLDPQWQRTSDADKALTIQNIALGEPMLNARAIRKSLFKKAGPFDLAYSLASDRDFLLKLTALQPQAATVDAPTYRYRWHEGSRTMNAGNSLSRRLTAENLAIAEKHLQSSAEPAMRRLLKLWHHRQSLQAALCALEALQPLAFLQASFRATRINPSWPPAFVAEFLRCLAGWVGRGFKSRSQLAFY